MRDLKDLLRSGNVEDFNYCTYKLNKVLSDDPFV